MEGLGHDFADAVDGEELLDGGGGEVVERVEMGGEVARGGDADVGDAEAVEQAPERAGAAFFDRGEEVGGAFLAHAVERGEGGAVERVEIGNFFEEAGVDELVDEGFAEALDVHGVFGGEVADAAAELGRAGGTGAFPSDAFFMHGAAAGGAVRGHAER